MRRNRRVGRLTAACLAALAAGCAGIDASHFNFAVRTTDETAVSAENRGLLAKKDDRPARTQEAVADFERRRNDAQFLAAETHWRQGDAKRCRESLEKILARDPAHRGSVLLLADVHLEASRSAEAVEVLERGVAALPADAEIAYKLGVALEADGQTAESRHWLAQAAAKEPDNERYRQALEPVNAGSEPGTGENEVADAGTPGAVSAAEPPASPDVDSFDRSPAKSGPDGPKASAGGGRSSVFLPPPVSDEENLSPAAAKTRSDIAFQAALADWDAGRHEACEARLRVLLADDPEHVDGAVLMTEVELSTDRKSEARARIEHLVIRNPNNPLVRRACGITYEALGEQDLAQSCYAKADELETNPPTPIVTYREAVSAVVADASGASGDSVASDSASSDLIATDPLSTDALGPGGASTGKEPRRLNVAVLETSPVSAAARERGVSRASGSSDSATEADDFPAPSILRFETDKKAEPTKSRGTRSAAGPRSGEPAGLTPAALLDRGNAALAAGRIDAAGEAFCEAIRADRKNSQIAVTAAVAALKHEQPELSLQLATIALEFLPRSAGLHRVHGTALYQLGRYAEAEAALRQSLSLDNSQALSYFLLGSVQSRLGKREAADGQFRNAARLDRRYAVRR